MKAAIVTDQKRDMGKPLDIKNREMRGSHGASRVTVSDETRDVVTGGENRSESTIASHDDDMSRDHHHATSVLDLAFDLEQPWQRSLLRELENIEKSGDDKKNGRSPRSLKILLGHSLSGDYLVEYDDDDTSDDTDDYRDEEDEEDDYATAPETISTTLPIRPQQIHRAKSLSHSSLFKAEDETDDECGAMSSADSSMDHKASQQLLDSPVLHIHRGRSIGDEVHSSTIPKRSGNTGDEGLKAVMIPASPMGLPAPQLGLLRANALMEDRSAHWKSPRGLRSLKSNGGEEAVSGGGGGGGDADYQGTACMCMGFNNFLDFLIPPLQQHLPNVSSSARHKKRRTNEILLGSTGPSSQWPSSVLGRVSEEESAAASTESRRLLNLEAADTSNIKNHGSRPLTS